MTSGGIVKGSFVLRNNSRLNMHINLRHAVLQIIVIVHIFSRHNNSWKQKWKSVPCLNQNILK